MATAEEAAAYEAERARPGDEPAEAPAREQGGFFSPEDEKVAPEETPDNEADADDDATGAEDEETPDTDDTPTEDVTIEAPDEFVAPAEPAPRGRRGKNNK